MCPNCQRSYADEMDFCPRDGTALPRLRAATEYELNVGLSQRYRVIRKLGEGGMGSVFLAEQLALGRMVAIKVLRRRLLDDPQFLSRFQDEALSLGRINHQNVVTVHECAQTDDGLPYIAMQFLEGETLAAALDRRGALPLAEVAEILQQAARGLNAAHRLDIVHRDLKPDNIFLAQDDEGRLQVKIVDFGISKMRESANHTNTGAFIGTGAYMSPEQASGMKSEALDKRADVYSLGIVAYEMVAGRLPFQGDTLWAFVNKHVNEAPPRMTGVPGEVEKVVMKALEKKREQRYATAPEFAREFAGAVEQASVRRRDTVVETPEPTPRSKTQATSPSPPPPPPKASSAKWVIGAVAALLLISVGGAWYVLSGNRPAPSVPTRVNPKDGLKYVWIPPGSFQMGCSPGDTQCLDNEKPAHEVTISKGFWLGQTDVTQAAWKRVMNTDPSYFKGDQLPVENIDWSEATKYCETSGGRLPTEAEWEYAARAGSTSARYGELDAIAWYDGNSGSKTHAVGGKQPNQFGLYDMLGNVWQWVADDYGPYKGDSQTDPLVKVDGAKDKVLRGGSWVVSPQLVRASYRDRFEPAGRDYITGFRCVGELSQ